MCIETRLTGAEKMTKSSGAGLVELKRAMGVPSDLVRLAVGDLKACRDREDTYKIDMRSWHTPAKFHGGISLELREEDVCYVCMAGSVMANTIGVDPKNVFTADSFEDNWINNCMVALDFLRCGDVPEFLYEAGLSDGDVGEIDFGDCPIVLDWIGDDGAELYFERMEEVAGWLESRGL